MLSSTVTTVKGQSTVGMEAPGKNRGTHGHVHPLWAAATRGGRAGPWPQSKFTGGGRRLATQDGLEEEIKYGQIDELYQKQ